MIHFDREACNKCQKLTNYEKWRTLSNDGPVSVGFTVERDAFWEPFYIAKTSMPLFDERFKQYGYNRVSQVRMIIFVETFYGTFLQWKIFRTLKIVRMVNNNGSQDLHICISIWFFIQQLEVYIMLAHVELDIVIV